MLFSQSRSFHKVSTGSRRVTSARSFASSETVKITLPKPFKGHRLDSLPSTETSCTKDELITWYKDMFTWRRAEVVSDNLYKQKFIRGFLHLYNGQEAITAGMKSVITPRDHIITAYRDHAHFLALGGTMYEMFCEMMGKFDGCSNGNGGSMHFYKADANFHGGNGIVGAQVPVGAGLALGLKMRGEDGVSMSFYGDGAANQGQVFEAYNMAKLWNVPAIFICENNKFGMGTSAERSSAETTYYTRGDYVPGIWIDAMHVVACRDGLQFAVDYAKKNGPIVVEMETYRYYGHSMSDPGLSYRSRSDVAAVRAERDPIDRVKNLLLENNFVTEEELKKIDKEIRAEVDAAAAKAKDAAYPPVEELYKHIQTDYPYYVRAVEQNDSVAVHK